MMARNLVDSRLYREDQLINNHINHHNNNDTHSNTSGSSHLYNLQTVKINAPSKEKLSSLQYTILMKSP